MKRGIYAIECSLSQGPGKACAMIANDTDEEIVKEALGARVRVTGHVHASSKTARQTMEVDRIEIVSASQPSTR